MSQQNKLMALLIHITELISFVFFSLILIQSCSPYGQSSIKTIYNPILSNSSLNIDDFYEKTDESPPLDLSISYAATSPEVESYEVAITKTPYNLNNLNWTSLASYSITSQTIITGLSLQQGEKYYPVIRVKNKFNQYSDIIVGRPWIVDINRPAKVANFNDMNFSSTVDSPLMTWNHPQTASSTILTYELAIGSIPRSTDILDWTDIGLVTQFQINNLNLISGKKYYPMLRVKNVNLVTGPATFDLNDTGFIALGAYKTDPAKINTKIQGDVTDFAVNSSNLKTLIGDINNINSDYVNKIGQFNTVTGEMISNNHFDYGFNGDVQSLLKLRNGKILIAGKFTHYKGQYSPSFVMINSDGSVDHSFNSGTGLKNTIGTPDVFTMIELSNGSIVIGGKFINYNESPSKNLLMVTPQGQKIDSFAIGTGPTLDVYSVAESHDQKIYIGGKFTIFNGITVNRIVKLNLDGTIDDSFDISNCCTVAQIGFNLSVNTIAVQNDGKVIIGGNFTAYKALNNSRALVRLNTDGAVDDNFIDNSLFTNSKTNNVKKIIILDNEDIVACGDFTFSSVSNCIRLSKQGILNTNFQMFDIYDVINIVGTDNSGYYIIHKPFSLSYYKISKVNSDGQIITDFKLNLNKDPKVFLLSETDLIVGGSFEYTILDSGLNQKALLLSSVNDLVVPMQFSKQFFEQSINSVGYLNDQTLVFSLKSSFVNGINVNSNVVCIDSNLNIINVDNLPIQNETGILVSSTSGMYLNTFINGGDCAECSNQYQIRKLKSDCKVDLGFLVNLPSVDNTDFLFDFNVRSDGIILTSAKSKISSGGAVIDNNFLSNNDINGKISKIVYSPDEKYYFVAGNYTSVGSSSKKYLTRFNTIDNALDVTFDTQGGFDAEVTQIWTQSDGKVLVHGPFTKFNGQIIPNLVRLNADGTLDNTFNIGNGFNGAINKLIINQNGTMLIGGDFNYFNGVKTGSFIEISP